MEQEKKNKKKKEKPKKSLKREIFEWVMVFVVAAALAFVVRTFIFEPVRVDGSSMLNTLEDSEFMIATKFDYLMGDPERFDIVICDYPNTDDGMYRVKRVIGLGGDTITFADGDVYVNGEALEETYLPEQHITYPTGATEVFEVPEGCIFVMGDNRTGSYDSRAWLNPYIPVEQIRSRALVDIAFLPECTWKGVRLLT